MSAIMAHHQLMMAASAVAPAGGDPYFANVVALLHGNGTNGSTTITDSSTSAKTWTATNGAAISTAQSKFGGASILLDGTNDYLTSATHADWAFGTGDFTVETWARWTSHTATSALLANYTDPSNGWLLQWRSDNLALVFGNGNTGLISYSWTPSNGVWYHVAASRAGGMLYLFIDGSLVASTTNGTNISSTAAMYIGRLGALDAQYFNGYMDDIRITKGVARYTASFTPPTAAFPDS